MGRKRLKYSDKDEYLESRRVDIAQRNRQIRDKLSSIDEHLNESLGKIDWNRRNEAESDIIKWVNQYCIGVFLDEPPPPKGEEILKEMVDACVDKTRPYLILQARGSGKTSYIECVITYLISTGKKKFPVIISQSALSAQNLLIDIFRIFSDDCTDYANDYPEICVPFIEANGSYRRRQTYNGTATEISKSAGKIVLARLVKEDGTEYPMSQSCIVAKGIMSGIRGLKHHTLRPDLAVLDDVQDDESAESDDQVEKIMNVIYKGVFNLSGKGKISVLQAATPICSDDLIDRISQDKSWKTTRYPAIIKWPLDWINNPNDGFWKKYFDLYDQENALDLDHKKSLKFYKRHQRKMDKGAEVINPNRFKESDGNISALQALMDKYHQIGEGPFYCEYQMLPRQITMALDINSKKVLDNINPNVIKNVIPDGYTYCCGALDLNTSYAGTYSICCFKPDSTCVVIRHKINKMNIDQQLVDVQYDRAVFTEINKIMKRISELGLKINAFGIDANGRNFKGTCEFCKNSMSLCGIPCCSMIGKASTNFNPLVRSRLKNAVGRTVLCGDDKEKVKSGSGYKWIFFDSDYFRESVHRSFLIESGNIGSTSLYKDLDLEHIEFAKQICNEKIKLKKTKSDGRVEYFWKSKEPHDYLDVLAMCRAIAEHEGMNTKVIPPNIINTSKRIRAGHRVIRNVKNRIRFV